MDQSVIERRRDARFRADAAALRVTLRPGCVVALIDWSAGGALVQADRPLRPGARVHVQVMRERGTVTVVAHVLRCAVWSLHPDDGVIYRGALRFDDRCDVFRCVPEQDGARPVTRDHAQR